MLQRPVAWGQKPEHGPSVCLCREPALPPAPPCTCVLLVPLGPTPPELLVPVGDAGAAPGVGWAVGNKSPSGFGRGMQGRHLSGPAGMWGQRTGAEQGQGISILVPSPTEPTPSWVLRRSSLGPASRRPLAGEPELDRHPQSLGSVLGQGKRAGSRGCALDWWGLCLVSTLLTCPLSVRIALDWVGLGCKILLHLFSQCLAYSSPQCLVKERRGWGGVCPPS